MTKAIVSAIVLAVALAVALFGIFVFPETYAGVTLLHSKAHWERIAAACDEVYVRNIPAGPYQQKFPGADPSLPPAIRELNPERVIVTEIGVAVYLRSRFAQYVVQWHRASAVEDPRRKMPADEGLWRLDAYSEGVRTALLWSNKPKPSAAPP